MDLIEEAPLGVPAAWIRGFAGRAFRAAARTTPAQWPDRVELAIVSVPEEAIRRLSARHLGRSRVTDVLSFPQEEPGTPGPLVGDIVICPARARKNASRARRAYRTEVAVLLLHAILHLVGYDHERDDGTMLRIERALRRELRLENLGHEGIL